jgi:chromosome partitioning protein
MQTLGRVRSGLFPELAIRGLILTMFDGRTSLAQQVADEVRSHFPGKVFRSVIPRNVRLAEAPSHGLPISAYDPTSAGGLAYRALAEELLRGDGVSIPRAPRGKD